MFLCFTQHSVYTRFTNLCLGRKNIRFVLTQNRAYFQARLPSLDDKAEPVRCLLVVVDRLGESAVVVLFQSSVLHHF